MSESALHQSRKGLEIPRKGCALGLVGLLALLAYGVQICVLQGEDRISHGANAPLASESGLILTLDCDTLDLLALGGEEVADKHGVRFETRRRNLGQSGAADSTPVVLSLGAAEPVAEPNTQQAGDQWEKQMRRELFHTRASIVGCCFFASAILAFAFRRLLKL